MAFISHIAVGINACAPLVGVEVKSLSFYIQMGWITQIVSAINYSLPELAVVGDRMPGRNQSWIVLTILLK